MTSAKGEYPGSEKKSNFLVSCNLTNERDMQILN